MILLKKYKKLRYTIKGKIQKAGRNSLGRITKWHLGKGHKRVLRNLNFVTNSKSLYANTSWKLWDTIYDPNRKAYLGLFGPLNLIQPKIFFYSLLWEKAKKGTVITYSNNNNNNSLQDGNRMPLKIIPLGIKLFNLKYFSRSGGTSCKLLSKNIEKQSVNIELPSKKVISLDWNLIASLGKVIPKKTRINKNAGYNRWLGKRPIVRGVAINPVDHPHGGGNGKTSGGRPSVTPWGKITKGKPTKKKRIIKINMKFLSKDLLRKLKRKETDLKTHSRASVICSEMLDLTIKVHNGKSYFPLRIKKEIIGFRLGEFIFTRKRGKDPRRK